MSFFQIGNSRLLISDRSLLNFPITNPPDPEPEFDKVKVLVSGHSLSSQPNLGHSDLIASSLGLDYSWLRQNVPGATINYRLNNPEGQMQSTLNAIESAHNTSSPFTHLEITERHDLLQTIQWEETVRNLKRFVDSMLSREPNTIPYFWHCWQDYTMRGSLSEWLTYERAATFVWESVTSRVNLSLEHEGKSYRIRNAPAQKAWVEFVNEAVNGSIPGITQGSPTATLNVLFADGVHPTLVVGDYFISCVHIAVMYRKSPVGAAYPSGVTAQQALSMQTFAWEIVEDYYANESTPTVAQAQSYIVNTFADIHQYYYFGDHNSAGLVAHFAQNNYNQPFYFNTTTDAAYWFTPM